VRELTIEPLSAAAFAPFGQVIEADYARSFPINDGAARRFDLLATADVGDDAVAGLSIHRVAAHTRPLEIRMLETQPLGAQCFIPMGRSDWLIIAADRPVPERCCAFYVRGDQGVQFAAGIWRHPPLSFLDQDFLVVDRHAPRDALGANYLEEWFAPGETVMLERV
jgi:ureidoglycolate lyase